jgi:putative ABC transport system ATP-binding protein
MSAAAVFISALRKGYGGPPVIDSLDLRIAAGEIVAIMGRSGSGKSTLLKLIGALDTPDSGTVTHDGIDITTLDDAALTRFRRSRLGFVFQFFNLIPTLSARENIALPLALNGLRGAPARERVEELLAVLGLDGTGARMPDELSGGEQQRVAIARALAHRPGVIIADEPTGNLDSATAEQTLALLQSACRATPATLIMATHSRDAAAIADRTVRIRDGHILPD